MKTERTTYQPAESAANPLPFLVPTAVLLRKPGKNVNPGIFFEHLFHSFNLLRDVEHLQCARHWARVRSRKKKQRWKT